jgi:light-harvesting protein B-800-850 alpha chain
MNQGRIWCVVNPTVGLPLFLGSVAVTSLIVHYSVLSNTSWFGSYWNGHAKAKAASVEGATAPVAVNTPSGATGLVISVAPVADKAANGQTSFVITVGPKLAETAQADAAARLPDTLAMAAPEAK